MPAGKRRYGWLTALVLLAPALARADYKDSYGSGLNAVKDGKWAEVRSRMQEAIADHPEPAARVRLYGQRFEAYVPQFYLGLAAYKLGDCATALAQWKDGASQAIVGGMGELKSEQQKGQAACEARLAQQTPPKPEPAKPETLPTRPEPTKPEPRPEPPKPEPPKPEPPKPKPEPKPVEPEPPKPVLPVSSRVPAPLLKAFGDYLGGRYADVARINVDAGDDKQRAQALLVRAAARYMQFELGDAAQRDTARADVLALRALAPALKPDAALFSPRFRAFYDAAK